jgi:hypothetical protein
MDSDSDTESFSSIQESLEQLSELVQLFTKQLDVAEKQMAELQPRLEDTHVSQFNGIPFLETSPFRNNTFFIKSPGLPNMDTTKRYAFKDICAMLRTYIFEAGLVAEDGTVTMNKNLQTMFGMKETTATYIELMGRLRSVIV